MSSSQDTINSNRLISFLVLWFGQTISEIGNGLTLFALIWWTWTTHRSGIVLAGVELAATIAPVFIGPFAGVIVDRMSRQRIMLFANCTSFIISLILALLFMSEQLTLIWVYFLSVLASLALTFHAPAFDATIPLLIPEKYLGRANGLQQLNLGLSIVFAPVFGGLLLGAGLNLGQIILIDMVSFGFAAVTLLLVQVPSISTHTFDEVKTRLLNDVSFGFAYIWHRPGLVWLLVIAALHNLVWNPYSILLPQIVTEKFGAGPALLGSIDGAIGGAFIIGSLVMSAWGGPRNRIFGAVGVLIGIGFFQMLAGLSSWTFGTILAMAGATLLFPIQNGSSQAIWQSKVAPEVMGRVLAVRRSLAHITKPASLIIVGLLTPTLISADIALAIGGAIAMCIGAIGLFTPALRSLSTLQQSAHMRPDPVVDGIEKQAQC